MLVFYENELIMKGKKDNNKKLIFVENLKMFVENNKDTIKFKEIKVITSNGNLSYVNAVSEDGLTTWREFDGIKSKEDFEPWYSIFSSNKKIWSPAYLRKNLANMSFKYISNVFGSEYIKPPYRELCSNTEDLFLGFSSSYFNGYFFNNADSDKTYKNVYIYDIKSNHSAVMYNEKFPKNFIKVDENRFMSYYKQKIHFYGEFIIKVNKECPYFFQFGQLYNSTSQIFHGYFNDIDFEFIDLLGDIADVECKKLWLVELDYLPQNLRTAIQTVFNWKESEKDGNLKKVFKLFLEKLYGECVKRRFYETQYEWDIDKQELIKTKNNYNWEEVKQSLHHHYDYSWGVWTCSYVRLKLLKVRMRLGSAALYGDIDSIFFTGEENLKIIEDFNKEKDLLGSFAREGYASKIKFLGQKWYCWQGLDKNNLETFVVKCSGAAPDKVKSYLLTLPNPVESFSKTFPAGVCPYKRIRKNGFGKLEYFWSGGTVDDVTLSDDKRAIISCAGSGKTTTLVNEIKEKLASTTNRITVIAFTNKNVEELRTRIGVNPERLEIKTLDSLASSLLYGSIEGTLFEAKLAAATELLQSHPDLMPPSHLFVDEFQDLDLTKFNFINAIPSLSRFYIGDPNQSIYGYSGAENLFNRLTGFTFETRITNYRCAQNINDYAEGFLPPNKRPAAVSALDVQGDINFSTSIPDDDSIILCRKRNEVERLSDLYPKREIMTIHKSKGLTFDSVCVVGIDKHQETEEEQNIAYVACTRAKYKLTIITGGLIND